MEEYVINNISIDNVTVIESKINKLSSILNCEFAEISISVAERVRELFSMGLGYSEIFAMISDEVITEELKNKIFGIFTEADFVNTLCLRLSEFNSMPTESDLLPAAEVEETFTYVKNTLSDEAYDVFSQDFSDPRVAYSQGFREAAEGTSDKSVGFCILPLEEKAGVRIPGISSIIFSEDLKIVSVSPVFGLDGNADMKYALLSSEFKIPKYEEGDERYLEILVEKEENFSLASLLFAAEKFDSELFRISTSTYETEEVENTYYSIIFRTKRPSFCELLIFLSLFCRDYIPVGLYKNLE